MNFRILTNLAAISLLTVAAQATTIQLNDPGVAGIVEPGSPASPAAEAGYVNHLLSLGANATDTFSGHNYKTSSTDYNGTVNAANSATDVTASTHNFTVPAGWEYVLAKYGDNDVVIALNFLSITLPQTAGQNLFSDTVLPNGKVKAAKDLGLSHFTVFNHRERVPDGGATISLLGLGLLGLGAVRRKLS